jgi:hypothetical protein
MNRTSFYCLAVWADILLCCNAISHPISLFHRIWPVAGAGVAVIATVAWSGFLGYELFPVGILGHSKPAVILVRSTRLIASEAGPYRMALRWLAG